MHLLVLSAFRLNNHERLCQLRDTSQCTFWCSVLSDMLKENPTSMSGMSQCTFWCSVLSDVSYEQCFNLLANPKSQCTFWCSVLSDAGVTRQTIYRWIGSQCTFWCSVLSDPEDGDFLDDSYQTKSQCTFWCSVLSDGYLLGGCENFLFCHGSQCTFWCSVFSDKPEFNRETSMFYSSQCTFWCSVLSDVAGPDPRCLNAPSGAQCFPT